MGMLNVTKAHCTKRHAASSCFNICTRKEWRVECGVVVNLKSKGSRNNRTVWPLASNPNAGYVLRLRQLYGGRLFVRSDSRGVPTKKRLFLESLSNQVCDVAKQCATIMTTANCQQQSSLCCLSQRAHLWWLVDAHCHYRKGNNTTS